MTHKTKYDCVVDLMKLLDVMNDPNESMFIRTAALKAVDDLKKEYAVAKHRVAVKLEGDKEMDDDTAEHVLMAVYHLKKANIRDAQLIIQK